MTVFVQPGSLTASNTTSIVIYGKSAKPQVAKKLQYFHICSTHAAAAAASSHPAPQPRPPRRLDDDEGSLTPPPQPRHPTPRRSRVLHATSSFDCTFQPFANASDDCDREPPVPRTPSRFVGLDLAVRKGSDANKEERDGRPLVGA